MTASPPIRTPLPDGVRLDTSGKLPCLRFTLLERVAGVRHALMTRRGGTSRGPYAEANLGLSVGDERETVLANRALAASLVCPGGPQPSTLRQVHGTRAVRFTEPAVPGAPPAEGDMLLTDRPGLPLMVLTADCAALMLVDRNRRAIGVAHAGWRGTAAYAGREAVASMARHFGTAPRDLVVGIGPAIRACCYEVGEDVAATVLSTCPEAERDVVVRPAHARPRIDIAAALAAQLRTAGVPAGQIALTGLCTACRSDLFYSHRREGEPTGRFGALVCIDREL